MSYSQLSQEQRHQIYALLKIGRNQTEIAGVIGSHKYTISRELHRNCGQRGYCPRQAHFKALNRHRHQRIRILWETWDTLEANLCLDWSPEQIYGCLRKKLSHPGQSSMDLSLYPGD